MNYSLRQRLDAATHSRAPSNATVIPADRVRTLEEPQELVCAVVDEPRVSWKQVTDKVIVIHVTCRCGERVTLECDVAD